MTTTTNTAPALFDFQGHSLRTVTAPDGTHWFVASDVCAALGYRHTPHAVRMLDPDEKGVHNADTPGGKQQVSTVNESGLYSLVLSSRKPAAKAFKRWVTGSVLPSLRQHGLYIAGQDQPLPEDMTLAQVEQQQARLQLRVDEIHAKQRAEATARQREYREDFHEAHRNMRRLFR